MMKRAVLVAVVAALSAAGCMEVEQTATGQKQGKYAGKPDGKSWDNDPLALGAGNAKWTKGERTSWESQIRTRTDGQNEYKRLGQ